MGRVAIVTGGTRGIGRAISIALKDAGCTVVANYASDDAKAEAFTRETGIAARKWDVADFDACVAAVSAIAAEHRPGGDPRQQCRHHARRDHAQDEPRRLGPGARYQSRRLLQHVQAVWEGMLTQEFRPHRQYRLDQRSGRPVRPGQLRGVRSRASTASPRRWPRKARPRGSPSTPSHRAISTPKWSRPFLPTCWRRSSPASRSAGSARPQEIARGVAFLVADEAGLRHRLDAVHQWRPAYVLTPGGAWAHALSAEARRCSLKHLPRLSSARKVTRRASGPELAGSSRHADVRCEPCYHEEVNGGRFPCRSAGPRPASGAGGAFFAISVSPSPRARC